MTKKLKIPPVTKSKLMKCNPLAEELSQSIDKRSKTPTMNAYSFVSRWNHFKMLIATYSLRSWSSSAMRSIDYMSLMVARWCAARCISILIIITARPAALHSKEVSKVCSSKQVRDLLLISYYKGIID